MKNKILKNIVFFTIISFIVFGFFVNFSFAASCGSSNGGSFASPPISNLCSIDTSPSSVVTNPTTFNWNCYYDCCSSGSWVDKSASTPRASTYYDDVAISATGQYQAIGDNGDYFASSDYGATWTRYDHLVNGVNRNCANVRGLVISETGQYHVMSCDLHTLYSTNYGATWTEAGTAAGFYSLDASPSGQYLVGNTLDDLFISSNYGQTWTIRTAGLIAAGLNSMRGIYGSAISSDGQKIMVTGKTSGFKDGVFYSSNGGTTFTKKIEYPQGALSSYKDTDMSADGTRFAMIYKQNVTGYRIVYSSNSGTTFSYYDFGATNIVRRIEMSASGRCQAAIVGTGSVYTSSDYGASWSLSTSGNLGVDIAMSASGLYKAVVGADAIYSYLANPSANCFSSLSCSAINSSVVSGSCGSSSGQTFTSAPSTNLCILGTASLVTSGTSTYTWTCSGSGGGTNASCSATRNYVVTYDSNGGSCVPASRTVAYNTTAAAPSCSRTGYAISSFTRTSGSGGTLNTSTGAVTNVTGNQTIRADWLAVINGTCGSSSGGAFTSAPSTNLCILGTASLVTSGTSTYTWTCSGSGGGTNASCSATRNYLVTYDSNGGSCIPASRTVAYNTTAAAPSCSRTGYAISSFTRTSGSGGTLNTSTGAVTNVTGSQTIRVNWSVVVNGVCGTAAKTYLSTASSYGVDTFCTTGTASPLSPAFPVGGTPTTWQCQGSGGGTTATCTASKNRKPAIINGTLSYTVLASNKINFTGFSASDADGNPLTYTWGCTNGGTFTSNLITNPQYIAPATARTDTCNLLVSDGKEVVYSSPVTVTVTAPVVINGACGTAVKTYLSTATNYGTDTFCTTGTASPLSPVFPVGGTPTTWQCQGSGGGTTATCTASKNRKAVIINGTLSYTVLASNKINFTGFSASDADGNALSYTWGCTNGGTFTNNLIANPEYIAPATARTDTCNLLVSDGREVTTSSAVTVTVIAPAVVNGSCGTAAKTYASTASSYGADTLCAKGTPSPLSPVFPVGGTPTTWQCQGSGGGTTATCTAYKNRKPGIITGTLSYIVTINNKINFTGFSASDADGNPLTYTWACTNGGTLTNNLVANPQYNAPSTPRTDTCNLLVSDGIEVSYSTVTVSVSDVIVNGSCGTAAKAYPSGSSSYGLDTFCNPGTSSPLNPVFPITGTPTTWQCQGSGGGTTAICTATLNAPLTSAISADNFKNPLDVANDLSSTEEECWYCSHYKNTSNEIVPAAGGAVGNLQFKFNYQGTTNLTGYQFAMSTGSNPDLAVIKSDDWVNYSVAPGGTVTVGTVKIGGINNNISVKPNASEALAQIPYNSSPYNWWVKVKNSGGEQSAWIPATGHSYNSKSHRYPVVRVALRSIVNDLLACTTVASSGLVFNTTDPCYATCGAANITTATDLENSTKWKCSICYDQATNTPKPCAINSVTWELPSSTPAGFGLKTGSTLSTANPTFTGITSGQVIDNVRVTISGSSCPLEGGLDSYTPLPLWIER